jgi:hypothetical protein
MTTACVVDYDDCDSVIAIRDYGLPAGNKQQYTLSGYHTFYIGGS